MSAQDETDAAIAAVFGESNADRYGSPGVPMQSARCAVRDLYSVIADGVRVPVLLRWREEWWRWSGTCWNAVSDEVLRSQLYHWLERATYKAPVVVRGVVTGYADKPWNPKKGSIADLGAALGAVVQQPDALEHGDWRDGRDEARLVACRNVLVDPMTGTTQLYTPLYFNGYSLDFDYDKDAVCPTWEGFLESVWPGDEESKLLLRQWFGYVLSGRTDLQKLMYLKGLPRSGKGTIARILTTLLGTRNVVGPTFDSFGGGFGLELMVGAQLAVVGDARFTGDPKVMQSAISKILSITGEDRLNVDRKYKTTWSGTLPTRLMLLSNEMPWFRDSSSAIVDRMLLLVFKESFLGREDHTLELRLRAELPGIFNWALDGYRELVIADGRFTRPAANTEVLADFRESVSPIETWLNAECARTDGESLISSGALYRKWCEWCDENGYKPGAVNGFLRLVQTVWPSVQRHPVAVRNTEGKVMKAWSGIRYAAPRE